MVKGRPAKWLYGHQHRVYQENSFNAHEPAWYRENPQKRKIGVERKRGDLKCPSNRQTT